MNSFKYIGLSHQTAPLKLRELVALDRKLASTLLSELRESLGLSEAMVLSTCNRTEVYYSADTDRKQEIVSLLKGLRPDLAHTDVHQHFHSECDSAKAQEHLFRVAVGLEAQVVGDLQINSQIKQAYQLSADMQMAGPYLHRLMHTIFFANKRVVQETCFRDGAASLSYAAAELVHKLTRSLHEPKVLVVGLGEIGVDTVRNLANFSFGHVAVTNRTDSKAEALAVEMGYEHIPFASWKEAARQADAIICAVVSDTPLLTAEVFEGQDVLSHKFLIDLSVPRSIDPALEHNPAFVLYNIDTIKQTTDETTQRRLAAMPEVEAILEEVQADFKDWAQSTLASPAIRKMKQALEELRQEEVKKYLKNLDQAQQQAVEKATRGLVGKIMRLHAVQLKAACQRDNAEELFGMLNDLFDLEAAQRLRQD